MQNSTITSTATKFMASANKLVGVTLSGLVHNNAFWEQHYNSWLILKM